MFKKLTPISCSLHFFLSQECVLPIFSPTSSLANLRVSAVVLGSIAPEGRLSTRRFNAVNTFCFFGLMRQSRLTQEYYGFPENPHSQVVQPREKTDGPHYFSF